MSREQTARRKALESSRRYYAHRAYYFDLFDQRSRRIREETEKELDFIEHAFRQYARRKIERVLDLACGGGRHVVGLAQRGYDCFGRDVTPERVAAARRLAERSGVSIRLRTGNATRSRTTNAFDAVLAIYLLFLLPDDESVGACLRACHRALRRGGVLVCNIYNPFARGKTWFASLRRGERHTDTACVRGIRMHGVARLSEFDPIKGVAWSEETVTIDADGRRRQFRDRERVRLFTYWDMQRYLRDAGFRQISCYPDWEVRPARKPAAEQLVFIARK